MMGWCLYEIAVNFFFMFELITVFILYGFWDTVKTKMLNLIEFLCIPLNISACVLLIKSYSDYKSNSLSIDLYYMRMCSKILHAVLLFRIVRTLPIFLTHKIFSMINDSIKGLLKPFWTLILVQISIYYFFNVIGNLWFGGMIRSDLEIFETEQYEPGYDLNNFNDFLNGLVLLTSLTFDFPGICDMFTEATGNNFVRWYFLSFYYISVLIGLNIIVAYAIDTYDSMQRLNEEKEHRRE